MPKMGFFESFEFYHYWLLNLGVLWSREMLLGILKCPTLSILVYVAHLHPLVFKK